MRPCVPGHSLTPALFHGRLAETAARRFAAGLGEVVWDGLLTADTARALVERAQDGSLMGRMVWIAGPVDEASHAAVDVLLKLLEDGSGMDAVLWGWDELDIAPTLRSRCHAWWCGDFGRVDPWVVLPTMEDLRADPRLVLEQRASMLWAQRKFLPEEWGHVRGGLCRKTPTVWDVGEIVVDVWR